LPAAQVGVDDGARDTLILHDHHEQIQHLRPAVKRALLRAS